jgi:hypothetical protein
MTTPLSLDSRVRIDPDVVFRELDGEAVVLHLVTGLYFGLNEVGSRVWQLIEAEGDLRRVFEALRREYDVADSRLKEDLVRLIEQLREKGLVRVESLGG